MRRLTLMGLGVATIVVAGCRTATRVTDIPRVDLGLDGGNRGYLIGMPPEEGPMKTTRQMVHSEIEIPGFYKAKRRGAPVSLEEVAPPETDAAGEESLETSGITGPYDTYLVQKGDSLWSIAAKPGIYGKATLWRRLYDANRDLLKSPDRLRAGMTLKIPRGEAGERSATTDTDEGPTASK